MQDDKKDISADENERFTDEQTDKRVHEILSDEKDEVSEQDIKNIITGSAITDAAASAEAMLRVKFMMKKISQDQYTS